MAGWQYLLVLAQSLVALLGSVLCLPGALAAEVTGTVTVDYQGLFKADTITQSYPVSVALFPGQAQSVPPRRAKTLKIDVIDNRMRPAFLTIQKGDRVTFVNHDAVFHQLFSLSVSQPLAVQLGKAGDERNAIATVQLDQPGTTHVFCRIHNKSYARIDVVETPFLQMIQTGQKFRFSGLAPGIWKLRLASPGAETQWADVMAVTAPPGQRFTLVSRGGGTGAAPLSGQTGVEALYQQ